MHHHGVWVLYHFSYLCNVPYQLQLWAFTSSVICNAKIALSPPACSQPAGSSYCLSLCLDEISQIHVPIPLGNSRHYGYYANYSDRAKGGQSRPAKRVLLTQMAVSELSLVQLALLPLSLATALTWLDLRFVCTKSLRV